MTEEETPKTIEMIREKEHIYFQLPDGRKEVRYNLKTRTMQKYNKEGSELRGIEVWVNVAHQYKYFHGYNIHNLTCKEKKFKEDLLNNGYPYHRLITFFYPEYCEVALNLIRIEEGLIPAPVEAEAKPQKLIRRKANESEPTRDAECAGESETRSSEKRKQTTQHQTNW